jgi:hypothetical protein
MKNTTESHGLLKWEIEEFARFFLTNLKKYYHNCAINPENVDYSAEIKILKAIRNFQLIMESIYGENFTTAMIINQLESNNLPNLAEVMQMKDIRAQLKELRLKEQFELN